MYLNANYLACFELNQIGHMKLNYPLHFRLLIT